MPPIKIGSLTINESLHDFVTYEALSGTGIGALQFWTGLTKLIDEFSPLLRAADAEGEGTSATTEAPSAETLDPIAARLLGPQIVVPASEPRYILNAANARWSSLYDALYSSHLISEADGAERGTSYNKVRGAKVIETVCAFLDEIVPLANGSHGDVKLYGVAGGKFFAEFAPGERAELKNPEQYSGFQGRAERPTALLLRHEEGYLVLRIDRRHPIGREHPAGLADLQLESLLAVVIDFEDSVLCVDAKEKVAAYRNWLGVLKGSLRTQFKKNNKVTERLLATDASFTGPKSEALSMPGHSLLMASHAAPTVLSDLILDKHGEPVPETLIDAAVTALIAIQDLKRGRGLPNSAKGAIYAVKTKLRGSRDVQIACDISSRLEGFLRLPKEAIKLVLMEETGAVHGALAACKAAAQNRFVAFIPDPVDAAAEALRLKSASAALSFAPPVSTACAFAASPSTVALHAFAVHRGQAPSAPVWPEPVVLDKKSGAETDLQTLCSQILLMLVALIEYGQSSLKRHEEDGLDFVRIADRASLRLISAQIANWLRQGLYGEEQIRAALRQAAVSLMEKNASDASFQALAAEGAGSLLQAAWDLIDLGVQTPDAPIEPVLLAYRRAAKERQGTTVQNPFESMKGATRGLESGEAFRTND
ncbi:malate synthase [Beijerinckia indica]|uniref:Malate synthase n=1 Tax=Beijerinckia indica subsp. indica (strain ATCC 9039 / DSM 1715 / NCIMB 8712) TaxID=395963 RepID=B2IEB1_BEII9|nr:malate synthase [Beijerinckia indica]ACB95509.1 malate synthase [Beijerinckia indica subsp. indica ATCC 9039]